MSGDFQDLNIQIFATYLNEVFDEKLGDDFNTLDKFADHAGVSSKKLQRLLKEEGTSFRKLLDDYRQDRAYKLLGIKSCKIIDIATRLGYSSSEAFNLACKRWFRKSPTQMRTLY